MAGITDSPMPNIATSRNKNIARIPVDSQQTSFEANWQFKFFDDVSGADALADTDILIYKFTSANPIKLQLRLINGWQGGRKYIVYPNFGATITGGAFVDVTADKVSPINNDLSASGLPSHPVSGVTVEKRIATAFSTTAPKRTGTAYLIPAGGSSRPSSSYTASGNASGVAAGNEFLLVFTNINGTDDSEFMFQLEWEERFS